MKAEYFSYGQQLEFLHGLVNTWRALVPAGTYPVAMQMLLSLAESVKKARDHDLNCKREYHCES